MEDQSSFPGLTTRPGDDEAWPAFVLAGWSLIKPTTIPQMMRGEPFLTLSDDLGDDVPRPEFDPWYSSLDEALAAASSHPGIGTRVVAVGLLAEDVQVLIGPDGIVPWWLQLAARDVAVDVSTALGYDVIGFEDVPGIHSWLCHGYDTDPALPPRLAAGRSGLFETASDASTFRTWLWSRPPAESPYEVPWVVAALIPAQSSDFGGHTSRATT
jgi:hypothetical protein